MTLAMMMAAPRRAGGADRMVGTRCATHNRPDGVAVAGPGTVRTRHAIVADCQLPRLVWTSSNAGVVAAAMIVGGVRRQVTFDEAPIGDMPAAGVALTSDPIPVSLSAGQVVYVDTYSTATVGTRQMSLPVDNAAGEGYGAGDLTPVGSAVPTLPTNDNSRRPAAIIASAPVSARAVLGSGDSIMAGAAYSWYCGLADAIGAAWTSSAIGGATIPGAYTIAAGLMPYVTDYVSQYGTNNRYNPIATTAPTWIAHWGNQAAAHGGALRVWQATVFPVTSGANVTAADGGEPNRIAYNTWLRDGAPMVGGAYAAAGTTDPTAVRCRVVSLYAGAGIYVGATDDEHPLHAVIDVASAVEPSINAGTWRTDYGPLIGTDGLHPIQAAHDLVAALMPTALAVP